MLYSWGLVYIRPPLWHITLYIICRTSGHIVQIVRWHAVFFVKYGRCLRWYLVVSSGMSGGGAVHVSGPFVVKEVPGEGWLRF